MFAAIAGLRTHQSKMDVISNNIANVNTWGYKTRSANFQDALYQNVTNGASGSTTEGGSGGINSSQLGYGVNLGSITTNYGSGSRGYTGNGFDCMIDGTGFFIVGGFQTAAIDKTTLNGSGLYLSKVGIFAVDGNGYLVDDTGNYVYGFPLTSEPDVTPPTFNNGDAGTLAPIRIPEDASGERYAVDTISIGVDGTITGVTNANEKITIGQIAVASVENVNGLEQKAGYLYEIGANAGGIEVIPTVPTTTGQILAGYLEMSNVDLATEMASMITTQRGYQANSKIITVTDEMLEQLVNMKR